MDDMTCDQIIRNLYRILDEFRPEEGFCREIRAHLARCPACARRCQELESLVSLCREFPAPELSSARKRELKKKLRKALNSK